MKSQHAILITAALLTHSIALSQGHYPLHVGNRWDYGELDPPPPGHFSFLYSVLITGDTTMPNGLTYAIDSSGLGILYLRQVGDTVFSYTNQGEQILYDFSVKDGDTVKVEYVPGDTIITTVRVGQGQLFNLTRKMWTYTIRPLHSSNEGWFTITDGFGRSYLFAEGGYTEYLIGAIINGTQFGTVNSVVPSRSSRPLEFGLDQNYPNPFNPSTTIEYKLQYLSTVSLSVYDLLGRNVSTLDHGLRGPGAYKVTFNGTALPSGVYLCRLTATPVSVGSTLRSMTFSRRMILLK